jgi:hypothetical protein
LASSVTAIVLQQSVQLPHVRPGTSGREDVEADALECDAGWADEEIAILPSLAPGPGDIKPTHRVGDRGQIQTETLAGISLALSDAGRVEHCPRAARLGRR